MCKWCMSGSATDNSILLSVLPRLNKIFNQSINQYDFAVQPNSCVGVEVTVENVYLWELSV